MLGGNFVIVIEDLQGEFEEFIAELLKLWLKSINANLKCIAVPIF